MGIVPSSTNQEVQQLIQRIEQAFSSTERNNAEHRWDSLTKYLLPSQSGLFATDEQTPGESKTRDIFDITGVQANADLASTFHSTLTNPASKWSQMEFTDPALNDDDESRAWLEDSVNRMHKAFNSSNFDTEVASNYPLFTCLGTMSLQQDAMPLGKRGEFKGFYFKAWHLANIAIEENQFGFVDTIYRKFEYTKRQAMERFKDNLPKGIKDITDETKKLKFFHIIRPRQGVDPEPESLIVPVDKMPFESVYLTKEFEAIVERSGYMEFPNYVTRFSKMPGEIYGRGPGHLALPDVRTLNKMVELGLTAIAKGVAPPIFSERRNILSSLRLKPNGLTVVQNIDKIREMPSQMRADLYQFTKEDYKNSIRQAFFLDKLLLPPREEIGEMTAFETAKRVEQAQRVVGPVFGRLNQESLKPQVLRSFKMMLRAGAFADPPAEVKKRGLNVEVKFVNSLARSQQIEELTAIQQWAQLLAQLAEVESLQTDATDILEVDEAGETAARIFGVPENVIKDKKIRKADREERKQLQKDMLEAQTRQTNADAQSKEAKSAQ